MFVTYVGVRYCLVYGDYVFLTNLITKLLKITDMVQNIKSKEEVIEQLQHSYQELINWYQQQADDRFTFSPQPDKWTAGQHADHLLKSTRPVNKALRMPRLMLKTMFGTNNREERSYPELLSKYETALQNQAPGFQPPSRFKPEDLSPSQKAKTLQDLQTEVDKLSEALHKWKEPALGKYILPHPLISKLTMREMMYFTIFHTKHHHQTLIDHYA